jgi:hypothetical protein
MSEKRQTAGETADGTPASAGIAKDASGSTDIVAAIRAAMADAEAHGVKWSDHNTEPTVKTFRVDIRLDAFDRLKLGLLAARSRETPERWLEVQTRCRFDAVCDEVFGYGRKADKQLRDSFEAFAIAVADCCAPVNGPARLAFKPAVMA